MRVEWDEDNDVEYIWDLVKQGLVENGREVCSSCKDREKKSKEWVNDVMITLKMQYKWKRLHGKQDNWKSIIGKKDQWGNKWEYNFLLEGCG